MRLALALVFAKILVAGAFYTISVIGAHMRGLNPTVKFLFSMAFIFDLWATYDMYTFNPLASWTPHSVMGLLALIYAGFLQMLVLVGARLKRELKNYADSIFITHSKIFLLLWYIAVCMGVIVGVMHAKKYYANGIRMLL